MSRSNAHDPEYTPFDDDYRGFETREEETARGPLILAIAIGVLLIFGGVIWNTYRQGVRPEGEALPSVLAAQQDTWKKTPENPPASGVADTDKYFFDSLDATAREPVAAMPEPAAEEAVMTLAGADAAGDSGPTQLRRGPVEPLVELGAAPSTPVPEQFQPAAAAEAAPLPQGPRAKFVFQPDGAYLVQLAALRTEEQAETAWKRVNSSAPELYYGATKIIQRADLGPNGVFYRLRVGAFADRSEATAFCDAIKKTGATCIVVTG
jgi:cell division septation protein DedD